MFRGQRFKGYRSTLDVRCSSSRFWLLITDYCFLAPGFRIFCSTFNVRFWTFIFYTTLFIGMSKVHKLLHLLFGAIRGLHQLLMGPFHTIGKGFGSLYYFKESFRGKWLFNILAEIHLHYFIANLIISVCRHENYNQVWD